MTAIKNRVEGGKRPHSRVPAAVHIDGRAVLPILSGSEPLGIYVIGDEQVRWYPVAPNHRWVLLSGVAAAVGVATALAVNRRRLRSSFSSPAAHKSDQRRA